MRKFEICCLAAAVFAAAMGSSMDVVASGPQKLAEMYVASLSSNQISDLPLSEDVRFHGPLLEEPIKGRQKVLAFLNRVTPSLLRFEATAIHVSEGGACIETVVQFAGMEDRELMEVACLRVRDGTIIAIHLYFDPRPFLEQDPSGQEE